jgi:hypothetical protein
MAGSQAFNKLQKERPRKEKREERQLGDWNADVKSPLSWMATCRKIQ